MVRLAVVRRPRLARELRRVRFVLPRRELLLARAAVRRRLVVPRVFRRPPCPLFLPLRLILRLAISPSL